LDGCDVSFSSLGFGEDPLLRRLSDDDKDPPMISLNVRHRTTYRYRQPISLGPHRLMLRPRESRDLQVISSLVIVAPDAQVTWAHDVFGNAVATAVFSKATDYLVVESVVDLRLDMSAWPVFDIASSAIVYPFRYSDDEWTDLGALTVQQYPDIAGRLKTWARAFVAGNRTDTLSLLKDLSVGVSNQIRYQSREEEGTQSPGGTLNRGWGSCRDFAVLFVEAARSLGFGARIVSGYLFNPDHNLVGTADAGSTHAWGEVYVSGAGWISFDPTNRSVGGSNLIPVAVGRDIRQLMPVAGTFIGNSDAYAGMDVEVLVTSSAATARDREVEMASAIRERHIGGGQSQG
jgi:transglutaminase-like putative cysteine protease